MADADCDREKRLDIARWSIGGVNIVARGSVVPLMQWARPWRVSGKGLSNDSDKCIVDVQWMRKCPGAIETLFETHGAWSYGRVGRRRCFFYKAGERAEPIWLATFGRQPCCVKLCLNDRSFADTSKVTVADHPFCYPLSYLLVMQNVVAAGGLMVHAAAVKYNGMAWVLAGPSGAGKSTVARLLSRETAVEILSDDRVVIRMQDGFWRVLGTPWSGTGEHGKASGAPLGGFFFLSKLHHNRLRSLSRFEKLSRMMEVVGIPWYDGRLRDKALEACDNFLKTAPPGEFGFAQDDSVIPFFLEATRGEGVRNSGKGGILTRAGRPMQRLQCAGKGILDL